MAKILIIGLGNPILGDDGVGWRVADRLSGGMLPPEVEIDSLASGGIGLMERMVGYKGAVVIDAIATGRYPTGSVHSFDLKNLENPYAGHLGSAHETNLSTALELGRGLGAALPEKVMVVAIESPYVYDFSEELSAEVAASVEGAAELALELARNAFESGI